MLVSEWLKTSSSNIMVTGLITLRPENSLAEAADLFLKKQVSGAPVVDEQGKCVGVLSYRDLIRAAGTIAELQEQAADEFFAMSDLILPSHIYQEKMSDVEGQLDDTGLQPVSRFMVTDLVTVCRSDSIEKVIHHFLDARIHRVLVLGEQDQLQGIISTIDVLASLVRVPA